MRSNEGNCMFVHRNFWKQNEFKSKKKSDFCKIYLKNTRSHLYMTPWQYVTFWGVNYGIACCIVLRVRVTFLIRACPQLAVYSGPGLRFSYGHVLKLKCTHGQGNVSHTSMSSKLQCTQAQAYVSHMDMSSNCSVLSSRATFLIWTCPQIAVYSGPGLRFSYGHVLNLQCTQGQGYVSHMDMSSTCSVLRARQLFSCGHVLNLQCTHGQGYVSHVDMSSNWRGQVWMCAGMFMSVRILVNKVISIVRRRQFISLQTATRPTSSPGQIM